WQLLLDPEAVQLNASGTVPMAAALPMGGNKLTGLAAGTEAGDSVRWEQVLKLDMGGGTGNIMAADLNMGSQPRRNTGTALDPGDAARYGDFKSGASDLTLVGGDRSTTGPIDINFVPRLLAFQLFEAQHEDGSRFYSSVQKVFAQNSPGSKTFGLLMYDE